MIALNYKLTSFQDYLSRLAAVFETTVEQNKMVIPAGKGQGFFQAVQLLNGLEALVYNFSLKEDLVLKREPAAEEYYTLALEEIDNKAGFTLAIGSEPLKESERSIAFYLTSFLYDVESVLYKDVTLKGVRVLLTAPWMHKYLQLKEKENVLEKYINLKTCGVWYKPVDDSLRMLLDDVVRNEESPLLFYQNKILRIIESFFEWLYDEMKMLADKSGINRHDIEMAQKIEAILTNDVTRLPPTIREMAKEAAMSESKLKKIFKTVYSLPPYEYYQKQRMQKAKIMLLTGGYSIKDVGYTLGYSNLSNFTLAFKKVFGKLPSEVVKERR
jgi:AraC-like DNA-binding protein